MVPRKKAYLALLVNAVIWGLALPLAKRGFAETGPMTFLFYRYVFAVIASLPFMFVFWRKIKCRLAGILEMAAIAIFSTVLGHWLLYQGLERSSSLEASLLTILIPIFITLGGVFFLKETITKREKVGTIIAFLGSLLIVVEPLFLNHQKLSSAHSLGNLMILAYNFSWVLAVLWMKRVVNKYHPFTLVFISFVVGLLGFLPLALIENPLLFSQNYFTLPNAFFASLYMGTLGSVGAFFLYQYGQKFIEASEASLFTYLTVLFAAPLAIFWLGEKITLPFIIGGIIVALGVILAESRRQFNLSKK